MISPSRIELGTLGTLSVRDDRGTQLDHIAAQVKRIALLVYLAMTADAGAHCRRDTLLGLFWPELDDHHAHAALRQAIHVLRQAIGHDAILTRGRFEVGINPDLVRCDARTFLQLADRGEHAPALTFYRGAFLDGFYLSGSTAFERWMEEVRTMLARVAARSAWELAGAAEVAGDAGAATHWAERATTILPHDEDSAVRLITTLWRVGNRTGAVDAYRRHARSLRAEYGLEPRPELVALLGQLPGAPSAGRPSSVALADRR